MAPSLAICIPSKDRQSDVLRCLESVRTQSIAPLEILVIDQSQTPYALPPMPGLIHVYEPTLSGVAQARNVGVRRASADVILFLDDDVELMPRCLSVLLAGFDGPGVVAVGCHVANEDHEIGWWSHYTRFFARGFFNNARYRQGDGKIALRRLSGCAAAVRRDVLQKEPFDENLIGYSYGEDWEESYRVARHGKLLWAGDAMVIHHLSPSNRYSEAQMQRDRWDNFLYFYDKLDASQVPMNRIWRLWWMTGESLLWLKQGNGLPFFRRAGDNRAYSRSLRRDARHER